MCMYIKVSLLWRIIQLTEASCLWYAVSPAAINQAIIAIIRPVMLKPELSTEVLFTV